MHPDVKSLVYVAAVQPDVGERLSDLADKMPPANKSIGPVGDGFLAVNPEAFPTDFAADAPKPFWLSIPRRFRLISPRTLPSRSRALWQYPKYRSQLKRFTPRPQLRPGNKSRATQSFPCRTG